MPEITKTKLASERIFYVLVVNHDTDSIASN